MELESSDHHILINEDKQPYGRPPFYAPREIAGVETDGAFYRIDDSFRNSSKRWVWNKTQDIAKNREKSQGISLSLCFNPVILPVLR